MRRFATIAWMLVATPVAPALAQDAFAGRWEGEVVRDGAAWRLVADLVPNDAGLAVFLDFPDYGLYYRRSDNVVAAGGDLRIRYVSGRDTVILAATRQGDSLVGTWSGLGVAASLRLARVGAAPPRLVEEDIEFTNGDVRLRGTLVRPPGPGPYPAVVWVHGSGPQTRAEDFYRDRAYLAARQGIAALIYDKRGSGGSSGDPIATLDALAGDAVAAAQFLMQRPDIRHDRLGVAGFSQGGYVAPLAAARYGHFAFVIVGAAPGVTPQEQNDFAVGNDLRRAEVPATQVARLLDLRRRVAAYQRTGGPDSTLDADLRDAAASPGFRRALLPAPPVPRASAAALGVLEFDPLPVWSELTRPVLAVWGADDALVPVERSRVAIAGALQRAGNRDATLRVFPRAGHGLAVTRDRDAPWDWPRLAPGFHDLLISWLVAHTQPHARVGSVPPVGHDHLPTTGPPLAPSPARTPSQSPERLYPVEVIAPD